MSQAHDTASHNAAKRRRVVPIRPSSATPKHTIFISHAGEDKSTIAIPLREKLLAQGIAAFVDETDMPAGTPASDAMISAMETAEVAVVVLSPEFIARKWPMKELMCFLRRREESSGGSQCSPIIIPFFYRLSISELYDEPRLDRIDIHGNSLYEHSRFHERMSAGEPEANIERITKAIRTLHGIMGVRNDLDASNDNTFVMYRRREFLLQELCDKVCQSVQTQSMTQSTNVISSSEDDVFHAYFEPTPDVSDFVFDYEARFEECNTETHEARLLKMVLDESRTGNRVIAIRGIAGVGKTSMLHGISSLDRVKEHFPDGVHHVSLGMDGTKRNLIEELSTAVERSGGQQTAKGMRKENEIRKVTKSFRSWFRKKKCLFAIDDVWHNQHIRAFDVRELMTLQVSGVDSKVLLTTRSSEIASRAGTRLHLKPRSTFDNESRSILLRYADLKPQDDEDEKAVTQILERCSGLPLFLAIAGKAVKVLSLRHGHEGCTALHTYAQNLKENMQVMLRTDDDHYTRLDSRLMISIDLLEQRKDDLGFNLRLSIAEIHRRLSALTKQLKVPMRMLEFLWELENEIQAATVARELEHVGLAEVDFERRESGVVEVLRLHDSLLEFAVAETRKHGEERVAHEAVLRGYSRGLAVADGVREWWGRHLEADGYIHSHLCRHLRAAGRSAELIDLLLSPQWTERQLKVNGLLNLEADFSLGIEAVPDEIGDKSRETEEVLNLILGAIILAWPYVVNNFRELGFQLHGRLKVCGERYPAIRNYAQWYEIDGTRPFVRCINSFLGRPGGANTRITSIGEPAYCMVVFKDRKRVACGTARGQIFIVDTLSCKVEKHWKAHDGEVYSIGLGRDSTRLVSASAYGEAKVWDAENGCCVMTFEGHPDHVFGIELMNDDKRVVSVSEDSTAQVWDLDTGTVMSPPFTGHQTSVQCVAVLGDGNLIITGGCDNKLRMWDPTSGLQLGVAFEGHEGAVNCAAVTRDGKRLVSGSDDCTVRVWNIETHQQIGASLAGHRQVVWCVAVSKDGRRIASGSGDGTIRVWDSESAKQVCSPLEGHGSAVEGVSILGHDDLIVSCSRDGTVRLWDLRMAKEDRVSDRHEDQVRGVSFTPDGLNVVSGSMDRTLRIWDVASRRQVGDPLDGHWGPSNGIAIAPNGRLVVSISEDKSVYIGDLQTRKLLHALTGHTDEATCVAVTPQGSHVVTGSDDRTVRVWDLVAMDGSHVVLKGHSSPVKKVFVTDDGLRIVSVDLADEILVCDLDTKSIVMRTKDSDLWSYSRSELFEFVGEESNLNDDPVHIESVQHEIIVYEEDRAIKVLATVEAPVCSWALSPDKKIICLGFEDGQVGFVKLEW